MDRSNSHQRWPLAVVSLWTMITHISLYGVGLAVLIGLSTALPARASVGCDNVDMLLSRAYPNAKPGGDGFDIKGAYPQHVESSSVACKVWPADPSLTLMAVPLVEADPVSTDETRGDVEILVLDSADGHPIARRVEKEMALSDAIRFERMTLDTARYDIRAGVRAFGLRTEQGGSSPVNPYTERALWLYTFKGGRISRVLDGLIVERNRGENDGNCKGDSQTIRRAVSLGAAGRDGYRDLVVDQTETDEISTKVDQRCQSTRTPGATVRQVLGFGESRYELPADIRPKPDHPEDDWFSLIMTPPSGPASAVAESPVVASARPSFNCAKADSQAEKAICKDASLAKADTDVAGIYRQRQRDFAPAAAAQLSQDETEFLASRERVFGFGFGDAKPGDLLRELLEGRTAFLRSLRIPSDDGLAGTWRNVSGIIEVKADGNDRFSVEVNGNEPVTARWVCSTHGKGQLVNGILEIGGEEDGSKLILSRDGQTLKVQAVPPPNRSSWTPEYCGLNGSVEGGYFAVSLSK